MPSRPSFPLRAVTGVVKLAGRDDEHSLREPVPYDAPSPLGDVHMLAPPVRFSATGPSWPAPLLVPRGSGRPGWEATPAAPPGQG
jgi:hypothetical protein